MRKNKEYNKGRRTSSWKSNPEFDNLLGDLDISSLRFLKQKREKDLNYFRSLHDIRDPSYYEEYRELQQTYKMICEELTQRKNDTNYGFGPSSNSDNPTSYYMDEEGVYLEEDEEEDDGDFTDYELCDESIKYDWKEWCKRKGLDRYASERN